MWRSDDKEAREWLGGEAHVPFNEGGRSSLCGLRSLVSDVLPVLAGAVLGSLGTVGIMNAESHRQKVKPGEQTERGAGERRESLEQADEGTTRERDDNAGAVGTGTVLAAFGFGLLAGAVVALLTTPESGSSVRRRLKRGVDRARHELDDIVEEAGESWSQVRDDARDAVKRTATKIKGAAQVTKDAVTQEPSPVRKTP